MALPAPRPRLTVIDGRSTADKIRDEAHIESIALCDDVIAAAAKIIDAATGNPVPSLFIVNEATRLAYKADFAKAELLALTTPDGAA